jgi:hypothetical protein
MINRALFMLITMKVVGIVNSWRLLNLASLSYRPDVFHKEGQQVEASRSAGRRVSLLE